MASIAINEHGHGLRIEWYRPRILIIGAGSRGHAYARAIDQSTNGIVSAVAEPLPFKRQDLGRRYIWKSHEPTPEQAFNDWRDFVKYEMSRQKRAAAGETTASAIDAALICVLDEQHAEVITALAPLGLHIMSEKPLATTLDDCLNIYSAMLPRGPGSAPNVIFGIGHVLRYSPHNMMLRSLLLEEIAIGDVLSIEHTEPVGWWHFSHSYVRGNWRKESFTAPSLLTKSCHDVDLILWLLCSPVSASSSELPHLPSTIVSSGHLSQYRKVRKPVAAGNATNCLACPIEQSCIYSAKKIYLERFLRNGKTDWPVKIVNPEIEECFQVNGLNAAERMLLGNLAENYDVRKDSADTINSRPWFGRCVWESSNDVCDDQTVTITWKDDIEARPRVEAQSTPAHPRSRLAKTATFHMIAQTEAQCERRGRVYGTHGEITYDSKSISVFDFATSTSKVHNPAQRGGGHGGGDDALAEQFVAAVEAVKNGKMSVDEAQKMYIGCTIEEVIRSHAAVFAAEESRHHTKVVHWDEWWDRNIEKVLEKNIGTSIANSQ